MAGVAGHSDYRHDPWGRLQRTADFLAATTFGPAAESRRAVDMVKAVHTRVRGVASDGRAYEANDPHLLKWVHLAEVDSFLAAHDRFGSVRLTNTQRDGYVDDMSRIASALGVIDPPRSVADVRQQLGAYRKELRSTPEARDAARYLLFSAPLPIVARGPYAVLAAAAVSILPVWARPPLRLPWLPVSERIIVEPAGNVLVSTLRWAMAPSVPFSQQH
jgi:uncharacterized protein (DUF2236 family)